MLLKSFSFCKLFGEDIVQHFIFKPPFEFQELNLIRRRGAAHVTMNYHHMGWNDVEHRYKIMFIQILVKGLEKANYLNSILPRKLCYNVENLDCPNFKIMKTSFSYKNPCSPVSSLNVVIMKEWPRNLLENSLPLCNDAIGVFREHGFFSLSQRELYFQFPTNTFSADFLESQCHKFPPQYVVYNAYLL